jgi:hypothetical protein
MPVRPHFALPFRFETHRGGVAVAAVTEQDSLAEIGDAVELCLRFEQGDRRAMPSYGRPRSLAFTTDAQLAASQVRATVDEAEPRVQALTRGAFDLDDPGLLRILTMYETGAVS